jgi:predicted DsbA family dithiol-disulfide isomerase
MQEQYVNDTDWLLLAAEAAGLPRDAAAAALEDSGPGEQLVQQELGKFAGVNGVPHFVINGRCATALSAIDQSKPPRCCSDLTHCNACAVTDC